MEHRISKKIIEKPNKKQVIILFLLIFFTSFIASVAFANSRIYRNQKNHFVLKLPEGWKEIPKSKIDEKMRLISQTAGTKFINYDTGFQPSINDGLTYPSVLVQFTQAQIDWNEFKKLAAHGISQGMEKVIKKYESIYKASGLDEPFIDHERKAAFFQARLNVPGVGEVKSISAIFLGKQGMTQIIFSVPTSDYESYISDFKSMIESFNYEEGYRYEDRSFTDSTIGYDLGGVLYQGLVGGAAAFIVILGIWLFSFLKKGSKVKVAKQAEHEKLVIDNSDGSSMVCPKCSKTFDHTWRVCLYCSTPLLASGEFVNKSKSDQQSVENVRIKTETKDESKPGRGLMALGALGGWLLGSLGAAITKALLFAIFPNRQLPYETTLVFFVTAGLFILGYKITVKVLTRKNEQKDHPSAAKVLPKLKANMLADIIHLKPIDENLAPLGKDTKVRWLWFGSVTLVFLVITSLTIANLENKPLNASKRRDISEPTTRSLQQNNSSESGRFLSLDDRFEVTFPTKPEPLKNQMDAYGIQFKTKGFQSVTDLGIFNVIINYFDGKILSNEAKDAFFDDLLETHLNTHDNSKLIESKRTIFLGHDAMRSVISFDFTSEGQKLAFYREAITLLNGNMAYTISVLYPIGYEDQAKPKATAFFNSFRLLNE